MAEWLRRGLQILARRFDSGSGLHIFLVKSATCNVTAEQAEIAVLHPVAAEYRGFPPIAIG
ncbi:hypothetical protein NOVOSPHI9U_420197 [Novosphingobium sp. 9U]|nr:hypothetical protein NOVOSPHI9U_420197 [Novosphingobium sp. 9U]